MAKLELQNGLKLRTNELGYGDWIIRNGRVAEVITVSEDIGGGKVIMRTQDDGEELRDTVDKLTKWQTVNIRLKH